MATRVVLTRWPWYLKTTIRALHVIVFRHHSSPYIFGGMVGVSSSMSTLYRLLFSLSKYVRRASKKARRRPVEAHAEKIASDTRTCRKRSGKNTPPLPRNIDTDQQIISGSVLPLQIVRYHLGIITARLAGFNRVLRWFRASRATVTPFPRISTK